MEDKEFDRVVILTTPTSGTQSLWRIVSSMVDDSMPRTWFIDDCLKRGLAMESIRDEHLPERGCLNFNQPHLFNFDQDFERTKFIVNFRDPRDLVCNQFHWVQSHPDNSKTEDQLAEWRKRVWDAGIDQYALRVDNDMLFTSHHKLAGAPELRSKAIFVSYIQLCLDTEGLISRLAEFLGFNDSLKIERLKEDEHPSVLVKSNRWIGGQWGGADIFPGRARVELSPKVYRELTNRYGSTLALLKELDDPRFAYFYGP